MSSTFPVVDPNLLIDGAIPWKDVPVARRRWFVWLFAFVLSPIAIYLSWSGPVYRNVNRAGVPYTRRERIWFGLVLLLFGFVGIMSSFAPASNGRSGQESDASSPSSQNESYFTEERFTAPSALKALYTQDDRAFERLTTETTEIVGLYVSTLSDEIGDQCGKFLTANGVIKEGLLAGVTIAKSLAQSPPNTQTVVKQWLNDFSSFQELQRHGKQDADRFLSDNGGCSSRQVSTLEDGIDHYFDKL